MVNEKEPSKNDEQEIQAEEAAETHEGDQYAELKENMLRLAAEFDNYKKRVKKEIESSEKMGKISLIKSMLPILDEFELAVLAASNSKSDVAKGIEMLYSNLMDLLKREGLRVIETDGIYDPYKHEIMLVKESEKKDGTILEVVKKGYTVDNKLLRAASVIISKKIEKENKKE